MNKIYELPTGYGKSLVALKLLDLTKPNLIVIPKLCLIQNWKDEMKKWGFDDSNVVFTTYISLKKHVNKWYSAVCCDEGQHLSERARYYLEQIKTDNRYFLSATFTREIKEYLFNRYNCAIEKKTLRDSIDSGRLPDPTVYLIRLKLDDYWKKYPYETISNKKKTTMMLTQQGYYNKLSNTIEWYKNKVMYEGKSNMKAMWMAKCLQRNKQLSRFKEPVTKKLLQILKNERVLTFCCDIKQSKELGDNFITSDNKDALKILQEFNDGKIDKITSCNILAEGISLYNCKYTIFNYINSSDLLQKQKSGRALRHCKPVIFIPYYENTREEELVNKMLELYNKDLVKYVSESYLDLKLKQ